MNESEVLFKLSCKIFCTAYSLERFFVSLLIYPGSSTANTALLLFNIFQSQSNKPEHRLCRGTITT